MKLLNYSVKYLSFALLVLVTLWSVIFYFLMLKEIKKSTDEALEHHKRLIIKSLMKSSDIQLRDEFDQNLYTIEKIDAHEALSNNNIYSDIKIYMQDADDEHPELEPVRVLTTIFNINDTFYRLKIAKPVLEQDDLIRMLFWNILALYILLILGIIYINNITLKKIWQPFYKLVSELKYYKIDRLEPLPITKTEITEFDDLQQAVNVMTENSTKLYTQQKEFIENAAHELQTPLAIASNKLELIFENETLPESQAQKIVETYEILQRLIKLNKSLLLLSKIENRQHTKIETVNINEVIKQNLDELSDYIVYKAIKTDIEENATLTSLMDKNHSNILISNLLRNAILHNVNDGTIKIIIDKKRVKILNTGIHHPLDEHKIFNRFHKENTSSKSTGIGLAIAKTISTQYDLQINYSFQENKHCFELIFPIN